MARHWAKTIRLALKSPTFNGKSKFMNPLWMLAVAQVVSLSPSCKQAWMDGCDISDDMLAYCQQIAEREGSSPQLHQQALHNLDLPRHYQTIVACGVFGIGVSREQDFMTLQRFYQHLVPGDMLLLEVTVPYEDATVWPMWRKDARTQLPEPWPEGIGDMPEDGREYKLHYRLDVTLDQMPFAVEPCVILTTDICPWMRWDDCLNASLAQS